MFIERYYRLIDETTKMKSWRPRNNIYYQKEIKKKRYSIYNKDDKPQYKVVMIWVYDLEGKNHFINKNDFDNKLKLNKGEYIPGRKIETHKDTIWVNDGINEMRLPDNENTRKELDKGTIIEGRIRKCTKSESKKTNVQKQNDSAENTSVLQQYKKPDGEYSNPDCGINRNKSSEQNCVSSRIETTNANESKGIFETENKNLSINERSDFSNTTSIREKCLETNKVKEKQPDLEDLLNDDEDIEYLKKLINEPEEETIKEKLARIAGKK